VIVRVGLQLKQGQGRINHPQGGLRAGDTIICGNGIGRGKSSHRHDGRVGGGIQIDFADIVDGEQTKERGRLAAEITALQGELTSVTDLMEKTYAVLQSGGPIGFVTSKLNELQSRQDKLTAALATNTSELQESQSHEVQLIQSKGEVKQLIDRLQNTEAENSFELRAKIASQLRLLLDTFSVGTVGEAPKITRIAKELEQSFRLPRPLGLPGDFHRRRTAPTVEQELVRLNL